MDHLEELKEYAQLHARGQGIGMRQVAGVLRRIRNDEPGDAGSWARVWHGEGEQLTRRGRHLEACRHYALARFPHHGDEQRQAAQRDCVRAFDRWRRERPGIDRLTIRDPDGTAYAWTVGLDAPEPRPLLVVMGGIVSVKEQWAPLLPNFHRLGFAAVVTELPGVGENAVPYGPESWRFLTRLLEMLEGRADTRDASVLALSFSGHLALRAAAEDRRIGRILTVGAPVSAFFTDREWWDRQVPAVTKDTLCRLTGEPDREALFASLKSWALDPGLLKSVRAQVGYVVSTRDEIIPGGESALLRAHLDDVRLKEFPDVHGSPHHLGEMRLWLMHTLLSMRGVRDGRTRALGLALGLRRLAGRLPASGRA